MLSTSDICDVYSGSIQVLPASFKAFGGSEQISADIETLKTNSQCALKEYLSSHNGYQRVLFVDSTNPQGAILDKEIIDAAVNNHWLGIVTNGYVRHTKMLKSATLGIWSTGVCPVKNQVNETFDVALPINFDGLEVNSGMHLYIDEDGAIVTDKRAISADSNFNSWFQYCRM